MSELMDDAPQSVLQALVKAEGELRRRDEQLAAANERIAAAELSERLRDVAAEVGVPSGALTDFLNRGRASLSMRDGRVTGTHGEFVNLRSWVEGIRDAAPHIFQGAPSSAPAVSAAAAPKPAGPVVSGNVKRAAFDQMNARQKHDLIDAVRAGKAVLVD